MTSHYISNYQEKNKKTLSLQLVNCFFSFSYVYDSWKREYNGFSPGGGEPRLITTLDLTWRFRATHGVLTPQNSIIWFLLTIFFLQKYARFLLGFLTKIPLFLVSTVRIGCKKIIPSTFFLGPALFLGTSTLGVLATTRSEEYCCTLEFLETKPR